MILAFKLQQRQTFLYNTIGYFEEERLSFVYSIILLSTSLGFMVLGNFLAWIFFNFYNEKFHPFKEILDTSHGKKKQYTVLPPNSRPPNSRSSQIHGFVSISRKLLIHGFRSKILPIHGLLFIMPQFVNQKKLSNS